MNINLTRTQNYNMYAKGLYIKHKPSDKEIASETLRANNMLYASR